MGQLIQVPITPSVLRWAIDQSGYSREEVADRLGIGRAELKGWEKGNSSPGLSEFRHLTSLLHRQSAIFFLDAPPRRSGTAVHLRRPPGSHRSELNPVERRYLREVWRYQRALAWVLEQLGTATVDLPIVGTKNLPEDAARRFRERLQIDLKKQTAWLNPSQSFRAWRSAAEVLGIFVFVLPLGQDSVRGFSVWHEHAPAVVVNSASNVPARIFTLFHEIAHLITRTDSACFGYYGSSDTRSKDLLLERWCERFAAALLIPSDDLKGFVTGKCRWSAGRECDLEIASKVARHYKVSLHASVLALVGIGAAQRSLFAAVTESSDKNVRTGGGRPRHRAEISEDRLGDRTWKTFHSAIREELMTRADAMTYLDIVDKDSPSAFIES